MDIETLILAKKQARTYTDDAIHALSSGMRYCGTVDSVDDLPLSGNSLGDLYSTTSGDQYVWASELSSGTLDNWASIGDSTQIKTIKNNIMTINSEIDDIKTQEIEIDGGDIV